MNTTLRYAAALLSVTTLALAGCAADGQEGAVESDASSEEGAEIGATVDELATSGPTYAAGTKLVTIANLNLRAEPNTSATVKQLMPDGSEVTVSESSGSNGWVKLSFNGYSGWGHTSYLTEVDADSNAGGGSNPSGYNSSRGNKLAQTAIRVNGRPSGGKCALEVSNSVERSGVVPSGRWRRNHAWALANGMKNDSAYQRSVGFQNTSLTTRQAPKGSIIGWRPGQCGYNRTYGHIEIIANDTGKACSDFCGQVKTCAAGAVFIPTSL